MDGPVCEAMSVPLDLLVTEHPDGALRSSEINTFRVDGVALPLIVQTGIWRPARLDAALTIRTTFTPTGQRPVRTRATSDQRG